ncbi:hypothetical protein PR048_014144 [Dryococelus australis]|uniref:DDE Tnp4 domain-containing protein n=1 Tax=Dryococelus australis TaxID=614101 RepID=A0ABQ9HDD4_9NEOP|nr:hypothetical protein PR048_014144 [Dryococelus australis]
MNIEKVDTNIRISIPAEERLTQVSPSRRFFHRRCRSIAAKENKAVFKDILLLVVGSQISITHSDVEFPPLAKLSFKYVTKYGSFCTISIADGFEKRVNFPNCLGAVDGKHMRFIQPANSGSLYFRYKKRFS